MDASPQDVIERERELARAFVRFADALVADFDVSALLQDLVDTMVRLLNVDAAGVLLRAGDDLEVAAASATDAHDIEVFQIEAREGPCRECVETGTPITVEDLQLDGRWPRFTEVALRRGVRAVHAIPLRLRGTVIGGLNLFHKQVYPWPPDDQVVARALADVATIGIIQFRASADSRQVGTQLQQALDSRVVIEQAKGMVAQQAGVPVEEAFQLLRRYSRNHNVRLRDLCHRITVGELDHRDLAGSR